MEQRKPIGYIIGGGLKENFRARLDVPASEVQEGAFVVVEALPWHFYGLVTDIQLGATDPRFAAAVFALLGTAAVYVVYRTGREFFSPAVGLVAAAMMAVSPAAIAYSRRLWGHSLIQALGRTRDRRATPVILRKLAPLGPEAPFSHHYHIATALEYLADPAAARPLADLLSKPGMSGHAIQTVSQAIEREQPPLGNATRLLSFREIVLARALHRCGDHNGVARRILTAYTRDLRGHFARHAAAVLGAGPARLRADPLDPAEPER